MPKSMEIYQEFRQGRLTKDEANKALKDAKYTETFINDTDHLQMRDPHKRV